jgi:hypothetical protein
MALQLARRLLGGALRAIIGMLLLLFAAVSVLWGAWPAAAGCTLLLIGVARWRGLMIGLGLVLLAGGTPFAIRTANQEFIRLDEKIAANGARALSTVELSQIWLGNLAMAVGGAALTWPHAALETAALALPVELGHVTLESAFPWRASPWLRAEMRAHARAASGHGGRRLPENGIRLAWTGAHYDILREGAGIMALGGGRLHAAPPRDAGALREIEFRAEVPIAYRKGAFTPVFNFGWLKLTISDNVFWAAQERGWLHPYSLTYRFVLLIDAEGMVLDACDRACDPSY